MANTPVSWSERAQEFETPWQACGWSRQSQQERFRRTIEAISPKAKESLLDFGCGTGELTAYLPAGVTYVGVDWAPGMLRRARKEHPKHLFQPGLPEQPTDLVVAAGTFNLAANWSKEETWDILGLLWQRTRRAMAVSLNASYDPEIENLAYTEDEARWFAKAYTDAWELDRWRNADILLVMRQ